MLSFGQRLKLIRKEAQVTQAELAEKLMVSVQAISKWECDTSMPDISLLVPLAAILGVTTDCLLGVGGDEKADREKLEAEVLKIYEDTNHWWTYEDNCDYRCYELYQNHIKKYPLDYWAKYGCATSIFGFLDDSVNGTRYSIPKEEEENLFEEAIHHLNAILNYDKNTTRLIEAKELLVCLYIFKCDFAKAESVAEDLPDMRNIKNSMLIDIYDRKKDYEKCIEVSENMCDDEVRSYLECLWIRARRISILGNVRKQEAIDAWRDLFDAAILNYRIFKTEEAAFWCYHALCRMSNDYIAISKTEKVLETVEQLTDIVILHYNEFKEKEETEIAERIKNNTALRLDRCYNSCFPTSDNIIANDPRFKKCEERLAALD